VFDCGGGSGRLDIPVKSQAGNQVFEQLGQMTRAVHIAEYNVGQVWNQIYSLQPCRDGRTEFPLEDDRYTLYCFQFCPSVLKGDKGDATAYDIVARVNSERWSK
jgi:hypothetical protein